MEILRVILGATGLIGSAWKRLQPNSFFVKRDEIENWFFKKESDLLAEFLDKLPSDKDVEIHFCLGDTNSKQALNHLMQVNCHWQISIAKEAMKRGIRIITYGSALEDFGIENGYFESKRAFSSEMRKIETRGLWTDVRLHTLYSDERPHPHMFLGQIYLALRDSSEFNMSSGQQLREFHHVDDDIQLIDNALRLNFGNQIELSHGRPIKLLEVAEYLFEAFNSKHLLNVNFYPDDPFDNYSKVFLPHLSKSFEITREPLAELRKIFGKLLKAEKRL